jgi:hypothetical protein
MTVHISSNSIHQGHINYVKKYGAHVLFEEYTYKKLTLLCLVHLDNGLNKIFFFQGRT